MLVITVVLFLRDRVDLYRHAPVVALSLGLFVYL